MAAITASMVKELRASTGAGMMEKKACPRRQRKRAASLRKARSFLSYRKTEKSAL